ncbi:MAG TPA: cytochrome d ubiquinol oxidase subunit II [Aggregatilinea sp.]|uniref:cytochrome d ubiquinol oxidase subunit II n=1 Tax=Aggregatilinea sp. TaxID=2806333 RepID=UPI002CE36B76|nr:cytochrome d ubiquinol oxidase subunit II [Aggregatilinea sp.]HML21696.1 cytochrome d ubiquinol oxidase subunit II [Aggregatilinea sp.]
MSLSDLWFILIGVLFTGFFFLEGFDYGVGILLPFLGKTDTERRQIIGTIGPFWDANEVWMITAGGAMFAAFPHWYATLFSGFYLALALILLALILRGVAFEFRSKRDDPQWRARWDWAIFAGSVIPALLWGVAFGNIIRGTPIDGNMNFTGNFFDLLSPYTIITGLAGLAVFILHGAIFITMRTEGAVETRAQDWARKMVMPVIAICALLAVANYAQLDLFTEVGVNPGVIPVATAASLLAVGYFVWNRDFVWAFGMMALTMVLALVTYFWFLYPNVMVSSTNSAFSLTVDSASSSDYTLKVMSIVALIFVPVVLVYQGWTYWVFRKRVLADTKALHY